MRGWTSGRSTTRTRAPIPSQTDVNLAKYGDDQPKFPGTLYLIVGVAHSEPDIRLWSIVGNDYEQVEFEVTE